MTAMAPLDPLRLPLQGIRLIEASAGTGKTWTLAALYVRLVLGHGGLPARWPAQILVVTFTRAATAELRQRIRERLASAAVAFRTQPEPNDFFLQALIDDYAETDARAIAARRLERAAQWMDEAAVHTIHGWCQRMLAQHAFEGEQDNDLADTVDENARLTEAVLDYWRRFYTVLEREHAASILQTWRSPRGLQKEVQWLLRQPLDRLRLHGGPLPHIDDLPRALDEREAPSRDIEQRARLLWRDDVDALAPMLHDAIATKALSKVSYTPAKLDSDLIAMGLWSKGDDIDRTILSRYRQSKLSKATNKNGTTPAHPVFNLIEQLIELQEAMPPLRPLLLAHAMPWITNRIEQARQRSGQLGYDDMLKRLDAALESNHGVALADAITRQYPVALIDEFQDTDPLQWRIFQRLFGNRPDCGLLLIGDPKQAIYSFRGADIHTYLRARDDAAMPIWTLLTNYRSTLALVSAINRVFEHADTQPFGAFGFGPALPFLPMSAAGRKAQLCLDGNPLPALEFAMLKGDMPFSGENYMQQQAAHAAAYLVTLLDAAQQDRCAFIQEKGEDEHLRPGHIAVLVRNQREANAMRTALHECGLNSVYLSDRDSVYASREAADLLLWLQACARPSSDRAMRAALATTTMLRHLAELDRLDHDDVFAEQCGEQFRQLHAAWQRHGVLAMLHNLLHAFDLPARALAHSHGDRALTNMLHLAELLQQAATKLDGEHALIRYLADQCMRAADGSSDTAEEQIVRLESEADLIRVITIHKSKGLQYPLVLMPFMCRFRELSPNDIHVWHDDDGQVRLDLQPNDTAWLQAERERLQEDLRLLYVALTRAEYACWVGVACLKTGRSQASALHKSALGYILSGGDPIEPSTLYARLEALRGGHSDITISTLPEHASIQPHRAANVASVSRAARRYALTPPDTWWIASYSALTHGTTDSHARRAAPETAAQDVLVETSTEPRDRHAMPDKLSIHAFPRGAEAGTFLHGLLEWAAEEGFAKVAADPAAMTKQIARRCEQRGWQLWIKPLSQWLPAVLRTPLVLPDGNALALSDLTDAGAYRSELEFLFEAHRVDIRVLDNLVTRHTLGGIARPALPSNRMNGMLRGFVDLIVEHDERFYIIDYKSNWLGKQIDAYTTEAMCNAVLHSRYDLQYALYTLALHRQLRARLPDYEYERHIGGVMYLFLRGVDGSEHGVFTEQLPFALIDAMDRLFAEGAHVHAA